MNAESNNPEGRTYPDVPRVIVWHGVDKDAWHLYPCAPQGGPYHLQTQEERKALWFYTSLASAAKAAHKLFPNAEVVL